MDGGRPDRVLRAVRRRRRSRDLLDERGWLRPEAANELTRLRLLAFSGADRQQAGVHEFSQRRPRDLTMNLNGTGLRRVTTGYTSDWSPSGNNRVFGRDEPDANGVPDGDTDIWMIHRDGSGLARLTNSPSRVEFFPSW